MIELFFFIIYR